VWAQFKGMSPEERERALMGIAETNYAGMQETWQNKYGGESIVSLIARTNPKMNNAMAGTEADINLKSALERINSGKMGSGNSVMEFIKAIQKQKPGDTKTAVAAQLMGAAMGGVLKQDLANTLAGNLMELGGLEEDLDKMEKDKDAALKAGRGGQFREQWERNIKSKRDAVEKMRAQIQSTMKANGLDAAFNLGGEAGGAGAKDVSLNVSTMTIESPDIKVIVKDSKSKAPAKQDGRGAGQVA
jgi:hypothetical protein